jgi:hypothetical protein
MKKIIASVLMMCLLTTLFTVTPAAADQFWSGVAIGVGSALILSQLVSPPPVAVAYRPAPVYSPPPPPPPVYETRWVPVPVRPVYPPPRAYRYYPGPDRYHPHHPDRWDRRY